MHSFGSKTLINTKMFPLPVRPIVNPICWTLFPHLADISIIPLLQKLGFEVSMMFLAATAAQEVTMLLHTSAHP